MAEVHCQNEKGIVVAERLSLVLSLICMSEDIWCSFSISLLSFSLILYKNTGNLLHEQGEKPVVDI